MRNFQTKELLPKPYNLFPVSSAVKEGQSSFAANDESRQYLKNQSQLVYDRYVYLQHNRYLEVRSKGEGKKLFFTLTPSVRPA